MPEFVLVKSTYKICQQCQWKVKEKITPKKYHLIMKFYKYKCVICGTRHRIELCHVNPKSIVVCNSFYNLIPMCNYDHRKILHNE